MRLSQTPHLILAGSIVLAAVPALTPTASADDPRGRIPSLRTWTGRARGS
jgi:hypothetical protein